MMKAITHILLIEDSPEDAEAFRRLLWNHHEAAGHGSYQVDWVSSLIDAAERYDESVDIVFLDLNLPGTTGISTMEHIAGIVTASPVVVLTTSASDELGARAIQLGAQDYLEKERIGAVSLRRVIEYSIERFRLLEEKNRLIRELTEAREAISELREIIPICSYCKNIRNDSGYWEQLESYLRKHIDASLSHGICPECAKKLGM